MGWDVMGMDAAYSRGVGVFSVKRACEESGVGNAGSPPD